MSNCNCGGHGCGPQNRPLEDWEYPDENEPTYDSPDSYNYDSEEGIYEDPNYTVSSSGDPIFGGITYAGAQYSSANPAEPLPERDDDYGDKDDSDDKDDPWIVRCPKCGHELYDDDTICPKCGQYITEEENVQFSLWLIVGITMAVIAVLIAMVSL